MTLHVDTHGDGPDLVLLHGWGMHGGIWGELASALAERFRVHCVDLPGHGASTACAPYTFEGIVEVLAHALPPRLIVCGWSLGGQIALSWAQRVPQQVERLVLIATTPCFVRRADWECGIEARVLEGFAQDVTRDCSTALGRFIALLARGDDHARAITRQLRERLSAAPMPRPEALEAALQLLRATDLRAQVGTIAQPALIVHGDRDTVTPLAAAAWLAGTLPAAKIVELTGAAHAPFVSHPRPIAHHLAEFCRE